MCELLAMSSRYPATVNLSFHVLAEHGGMTAPHRDGWGIAYYDGDDIQLLKEPVAASESEWARCVERYPTRSRLVLSHIRRATRGEVSLRNTQPFARELGGRMHVFAHNGKLPALGPSAIGSGARFRPVGTTDSELAFCLLLESLSPAWARDEMPDLATRRAAVSSVAARLADAGPAANFIYCDGDALFAFSHERTQANGRIGPPGLHMLIRECALQDPTMKLAGITLRSQSPGQRVALVASVPLSDETWEPVPRGTLLVIRAGETA